MCFECLQRQVEDDFSGRLTFVRGISHSALPYGSEAIVEVPDSGGEANLQFVLNYLPYRKESCLARYVDDCCVLEDEDIDYGEVMELSETMAEVSPRTSSDQRCALDTASTKHGHFSNSGRTTVLMGCENCCISSKFSCSRAITSLAPTAEIGFTSYDVLEEFVSKFSSGSLEDHVLLSLVQFISGKSSARHSANFLRMAGLPSFEENVSPGCVRHPNILPILAMLKSSRHVCVVLPKAPYSLENILRYSPSAIKPGWHVQFLIYQVLSALSYMHSLGVVHGSLRPESIMLTDTSWCWIRIGEKHLLNSMEDDLIDDEFNSFRFASFCVGDCPSRALYADVNVSEFSSWKSSFYSWWKGELSNFEYLLILNRLAGRRWGDHAFYIVMPWVIDFSVKPDENNDVGWRDLTKSKWRLAKGDEQLDFTYSTSETPHHVSDECLSELAVCSYKARRLPLSVLRAAVRSVYEPNEYPSNMQRLYQWTPDECIPEFYCDPRICRSVNPGMPDLALPSWACTPEEFIKLHRSALESNRVSCQIHHWIDIIFGYKMSGDAAIAAKNVMLPASASTIPRSTGRRQLFMQPHPPRHIDKKGAQGIKFAQTEANHSEPEHLFAEADHLVKLEEATSFCEASCHLAPNYTVFTNDSLGSDLDEKVLSCDASENASHREPNTLRQFGQASFIAAEDLLEYLQVDDDSSGYADLFFWRQTYSLKALSEKAANDIFAVGCILAEMHLGKPLFHSDSYDSYLENGVPPGSIQDLPHHIKVVVEACIQKDWRMRPSAKCLLDSSFFSKSVKSSYLFLAPFHLFAKDVSRLNYAGILAKKGALRSMGTLASAICAPYCLALLEASVSDSEADLAYILLTEFLNCMKVEEVKKLLLPSVQKILQATGPSHLKVSLLQGSFMQQMWNKIGVRAYYETMHPLIISNLCMPTCKSSATAASVILIGSSEEFGVPITVHQTILPIMLSFGKGLSTESLDVLTRTGGLFGEKFVVKQILPLIYIIINSCLHNSRSHKHEPAHSWSCLALMDCLRALDGLVAVMTTEVIIKELIEDEKCPYVDILMQKELEIMVLQNAAKSLISVCRQLGPDSTSLHLMPKLKGLFDELAFSQKNNSDSGISPGNLMGDQVKVSEEYHFVNRMDLVLYLYPRLASLLGIEKLRQCCAAWLLLEQFLLRYHNWKWEYAGVSTQSRPENSTARRHSYNKGSTTETSVKFPLKISAQSTQQLQVRSGWKSTLTTSSKSMIEQREQIPSECHEKDTQMWIQEPWYWCPSPQAYGGNWFDFVSRIGATKDEFPWKIRASIVQSTRAHRGALRSIAVSEDECTLFTAGVGPGFKGNIQKWEMARIGCVSSYNGHDEIVNDVCVLASTGRVASCDGTVHIWNGQTGVLISAFSESSSASKTSDREDNLFHFNQLSSGILSTSFHGNSFTTMDYLDFNNRLIVGTGNGSLRFIDVERGQKLHLWRSEYLESGFAPLISSVCSSVVKSEQNIAFPSWIAAAYSTGLSKIFDMKSGKVIASWQAHDGYVTKLAASADHQLISSSLDKTLRIWDLRRSWTSQHTVFRGYGDGVSSFSVWGQNVISVCKNKICLSSLHGLSDQHQVGLQNLYTADGESKNASVLSYVRILPLSRLFVVGTEDGFLKICC